MPSAACLHLFLVAMMASLLPSVQPAGVIADRVQGDLNQGQETCVTAWLLKAGIPLDKAVKYENSLKLVRYNEERLRTVDLYTLAYIFDGNLGHARKMKSCIAEQSGNCTNYTPCQNSGRCDFSVERNASVCVCAQGFHGDFCNKGWLVADQDKSLPDIVRKLVKEVRKLTKKQHELTEDVEKLENTHCEGSPCVGGYCVQKENSSFCLCQRNYHGKHCEMKCSAGKLYSAAYQKCVRPTKKVLAPVPHECITYTSFSQSWRRYNQPRRGKFYCDYPGKNGFVPGWYRFTGQAGSKMATNSTVKNTCIQRHYCGAEGPMYMVGEHPTMEEGRVPRVVCASWNICCERTHTISVRLCPGNYFVYYLPGYNWCSVTYCGAD